MSQREPQPRLAEMNRLLERLPDLVDQLRDLRTRNVDGPPTAADWVRLATWGDDPAAGLGAGQSRRSVNVLTNFAAGRRPDLPPSTIRALRAAFERSAYWRDEIGVELRRLFGGSGRPRARAGSYPAALRKRLKKLPPYYPSSVSVEALAGLINLAPLDDDWGSWSAGGGLYSDIDRRDGSPWPSHFGVQRRQVIVGDPGHGKSTVLAAHALACLAADRPVACAHLEDVARGAVRLPPLTSSEAAGLIVDAAEHFAAIKLSDLERISLTDTLTADPGAVLLLDGWDEVTDGAARRVIIDLLETFDPAGSIVVGSRVTGYARPMEGCREFLVCRMEEKDVEEFADAWFAAEVGRDRFRLAAAGPLKWLVRIPLLAGFTAFLTQQGGEPKSEFDLFEQSIELFLEQPWRPQSRTAPNARELIERVQLATDVALAMSTRVDGWADELPLREIISLLPRVAQAEAAIAPSRDGLLVAQGPDAERPGELELRLGTRYRWLHRTFHEHLAGRGLAQALANDYLSIKPTAIDAVFWPRVWLNTIGHFSAALPHTAAEAWAADLWSLIADGDPCGYVLDALKLLLHYRPSLSPDGLWEHLISVGDVQFAAGVDPARTTAWGVALDFRRHLDTRGMEEAGIVVAQLCNAGGSTEIDRWASFVLEALGSPVSHVDDIIESIAVVDPQRAWRLSLDRLGAMPRAHFRADLVEQADDSDIERLAAEVCVRDWFEGSRFAELLGRCGDRARRSFEVALEAHSAPSALVLRSLFDWQRADGSSGTVFAHLEDENYRHELNQLLAFAQDKPLLRVWIGEDINVVWLGDFLDDPWVRLGSWLTPEAHVPTPSDWSASQAADILVRAARKQRWTWDDADEIVEIFVALQWFTQAPSGAPLDAITALHRWVLADSATVLQAKDVHVPRDILAQPLRGFLRIADPIAVAERLLPTPASSRELPIDHDLLTPAGWTRLLVLAEESGTEWCPFPWWSCPRESWMIDALVAAGSGATSARLGVDLIEVASRIATDMDEFGKRRAALAPAWRARHVERIAASVPVPGASSARLSSFGDCVPLS